MNYTNALECLSKMEALDKLPANWIPRIEFITADSVNGYGFHLQCFFLITEVTEYCEKCGYVAGDTNEEERIRMYIESMGLNNNMHHHHRWGRRDITILHDYLNFIDTESCEKLNKKILNVIEEHDH